MGVPYKKVFNEAIQAVQVFFHDPVGNAIELNQENNTINLFSLVPNKDPSKTDEQQESLSESKLQVDSQSELQTESLVEPHHEITESTENQPEIQLNAMSNVIMETNTESLIDLQAHGLSDESILQSAVTVEAPITQSDENHSNETRPNLVDEAILAVEVTATPISTAQAAALQAEEIKPEPLINEIPYKCPPESENREKSDAPQSMSNMQKIIFGSLLLAIYLI